MNKYTYVSYLSSDDYINGILFLNENLKILKSQYPLIVICTNNLNQKTYQKLKNHKIHYKIIEQKINQLNNYFNEEQPRWMNTLNKIEILNLTDYDRCIYLDCDMLILDNIDDLFKKTGEFISGSFISPNICAPTPQSNILIYSPNNQLYKEILEIALKFPVPGGDEYYIFNYLVCNNYSLELLPINYNCTATGVFLNGFKSFCRGLKIIHLVGEDKPWHHINNNLAEYFSNREFPKKIADFYEYIYNKMEENEKI